MTYIHLIVDTLSRFAEPTAATNMHTKCVVWGIAMAIFLVSAQRLLPLSQLSCDVDDLLVTGEQQLV